MGRVVVAGATGFVGRHLIPTLDGAVGTSRNPASASARFPNESWARLDLHDPASIEELLQPGDAIVYLIHEMAEGDGYEIREEQGARNFADAAKKVGIERIIYLGGPSPTDQISEHLKSRRKTAMILTESGIPTFELQAGMIMGRGSESWCIARDLSVRLPVMLTPKWLLHKSEPIGISDVAAAIRFCLETDLAHSGTWGIPGPERLTFKQVLSRIANHQGSNPKMIPVPVLTPTLSAHWLKLVTRANMTIARELVQGLGTDLVCDGRTLWEIMPDHQLMSFDEAAKRALRSESRALPAKTLVVESLVRRLGRLVQKKP